MSATYSYTVSGNSIKIDTFDLWGFPLKLEKGDDCLYMDMGQIDPSAAGVTLKFFRL